MLDKPKKKNIAGTIGILAALIAGGMVFPYLFLLAAILGWILLKDFFEPPIVETAPAPPRHLTVTADDSDWKDCFRSRCESPAEIAFLEAMVEANQLMPAKGVLKGNGLTLDLQVKIPPYRADFTVNAWLVVEIDGAAYHTKPEAVERDMVRDAAMTAEGLTVLRIPAKLVFTSPLEAVFKVMNMVKAGKPSSKPAQAIDASPSLGMSLGIIFNGMNNAVVELNRHVTLQSTIRDENLIFLDAFRMEQKIIESAIQTVKTNIEAEAFMAQSPERRAAYLQTLARLEALFDNKASDFLPIPNVPTLNVYPDADTNEAVIRTRKNYVAERQAFFESTREKLQQDKALRAGVQLNLQQRGYAICWNYIA